MRPLLYASTKAIASLYNYRLLANASSALTPKTDHVITNVGGVILGPGDLNVIDIKYPVWGIEVELFSIILFRITGQSYKSLMRFIDPNWDTNIGHKSSDQCFNRRPLMRFMRVNIP